jgi:hypothetical protein
MRHIMDLAKYLRCCLSVYRVPWHVLYFGVLYCTYALLGAREAATSSLPWPGSWSRSFLSCTRGPLSRRYCEYRRCYFQQDKPAWRCCALFHTGNAVPLSSSWRCSRDPIVNTTRHRSTTGRTRQILGLGNGKSGWYHLPSMRPDRNGRGHNHGDGSGQIYTHQPLPTKH